MKLVTRNTDYSVRALCFMAEYREKIISVSELARELRIPSPFTSCGYQPDSEDK